MATAPTQDFIVKSGLNVQGTSTVTSSTGNTSTLQVDGGAAIAKNLIVGGNATIYGDLQVYGSIPNLTITTGTFTDLTVGNLSTLNVVTAGVTTASQLTVTTRLAVGGLSELNNATLSNQTNSTSSTTGALQVSGGVGIRKDLWVGGNAYVNGFQVLTTASIDLSTFQTVTEKGSSTTVAISVLNTTSSTSTNSGALTVVGGVGIGGALFVNTTSYIASSKILTTSTVRVGTDTSIDTSSGDVVIWNTSTLQTVSDRGQTTTNAISVTNTTSSTSAVTGALTILGGVGIGGALYVGTSSYINNSLILTTATIDLYAVKTILAGTDTAVNTSTGIVTVWNTSTLQSVTDRGSTTTNAISITNTAAATSTVTGALQVIGGVGIGGNLYVGGEIIADKLTIQLTTVTTTLIQTDDIIRTYNTTSAVSTTTGALQIAGGAGIGENLYVGGALYVGTSSYINNSLILTTATVDLYATKTSILAGTDTAINTSTGIVTIWNTSTLQSITNRGSTTTNSVSITNTTSAISTQSGALTVVGGVGVGGDLRVGGTIYGVISATGSVSTATNVAGGTAGQLVYQSAPGVTGFVNTASAGQILVSSGTNSPVYVSTSNIYVGRAATADNASTATTATNLTAGTAGQVPYQTAPGVTSFYGPGTAGQLLVSSGTNAPVYTNTSSIYVGRADVANTATTATNLTAGTAGQVPYQTAPGVTSFYGPGTAGQLLVSSGTNAPIYTNTSSIYVGRADVANTATTATNLTAGTAGQVPYQTAPGVTSFFGPGTAGNILVSNGTSAPSYNNTLTLSGSASATSTTTGALQVVGGVGVGGNLYVGGTIYGAVLGTATTATTADNVKTVLSTSTSVFFPVFVDSNNATAGYEAVYSSSTFTIIPSSGNVGIGVATPTEKLHVAGNYLLLKNTADTAAGAVFDSGSTLGQNTQILLRDRGSDKWAVRKNSANNFDIYGSAVGAAALTIFSLTNFIGIGATVIEDVLHVRRDSTATSTGIVIQNRSASGLPEAGIKFITGSFDLADTRYAEISSTGTSSPSLIFKTANGATPIERMRITALGGISFGASGTAYGVSGQILQSNGNAAPTWISTGSLAAANATTATHLSGGVAGQIPYQTAPGVTSFLSTGTAGNVLVSNGSSAATYNNTLRLAGATNATSTSSGALQVVGGVGVGGDLFIQGDIRTNDTLFNLINGNATTVNFAGDATTLTMGASGSGTTNVRNNLTVSGNLTVQGTTTIVDSTVTNIADPILTLGGGTGNTAPTADDNKDRGVAFKWVNDGGTTSTGFFGYDDSTGHFTYVQTATITNEVVSGTKGAMDVNLAGGSAMAIVYQSSPSNTAFLAAGTSGYILQTNGTGSAPSWVAASGVSAGSATYADQIRTVAQTASAVYYPTFVDSNNASNAYESVYTTGTFVINPATGYIGMGTASPSRPLHVFTLGTATQGIAAFEAKASGFVIQDNGSQDGNVELVGYKQTSSTYHNILIRGSGPGLLVQTGTGNVGIGETAPNQKLIVAGAIKVTGGASLGTTNGTGGAELEYSYPNTRMFIGDGTGWGFRIAKRATSATTDLFSFNDTGALGFNGSFGSSGQLLQSNGSTSPSWVNASSVGVGSVNTVLQTASASYYLTFVDSNNASATAESVYTTSSFQINPSTGNIQIGMTGQDYQPSGGGNHTLRLNAANTSSIGFHDSGSTIGNLKFSGAYGFEIGAYDGVYGPHNTILHGSVGIGTQNPTAKFTINNTGSTSAAFYADIGNPGSAITLFEHTGASSPVPFRFRKSGYSGVAPNYGLFYLHMNDGTVGNGSNLYFNLNNSAGTEIEYGGLGAIIRSNTAGSEQGDLALYVISGGTGRTERLRITSAGALAFSGASSYGSSGQVLQSNGNAPPTWVSSISGSAGQVNTVLQTASASYFPTFVDSNNAAAAAESLYTTSSFVINPQSGLVTIAAPAGGDGVPSLRLTQGSAPSTFNWVTSFINSSLTAGKNAINLIGQAESGNNSAYFGFKYVGASSASNFATIGLYGADNLLNILANGNVGIGVTGPSHKLEVAGATTYSYAQGSYSSGATLALKAASTTANDYTGIRFVNSNGSREAFFGVVQGSTSAIGDFVFQTYSAATTSYGERMRVMHNGNVIIGGNGSTATNKFEVAGTAGQLFSVSDSFTGTIFSVNDVSGIPSIEVIDTGLVKFAQYGGQVAINTGTVASSTASLSVYGMIQTMGTLGEIRASSEITAYFSSDRRLKENIKLIENPITIIDQIRGVTFDWTDEHMARRGGEDGYFVRKHDIGVIAQEVQAVLPELVGTREDGYLAVKYEKMVPLLIEAIKAQQKTIDSLVKDLDSVKEFINNFKNGI